MKKIIVMSVVGGVTFATFYLVKKTETKYASLDKEKPKTEDEEKIEEAVNVLKEKAENYKCAIKKKLKILFDKLTEFLVNNMNECVAYLTVTSGILDIIFKILKYRMDTKVKIVEVGTF